MVPAGGAPARGRRRRLHGSATDADPVGALTDLTEIQDLAITVDVLAPGRYTATVETLAYLVVAAALAEARSHGADTARVAGVAESVLRAEVLDGREPRVRVPGCGSA